MSWFERLLVRLGILAAGLENEMYATADILLDAQEEFRKDRNEETYARMRRAEKAYEAAVAAWKESTK